MKQHNIVLSLALFLCIYVVPYGQTAEIVIVIGDGASEGFNDPTPVSPVPGNNGTTLGQQRLIVFEEAARIWGTQVASDVTIKVLSFFDPGPCAGLGATGPTQVYREFPNAPHPNTWYHSALADALSGTDLGAGGNDMRATFNSSLDTPQCTFSWYYGLDGNPGPAQYQLLPVVLHELSHGLGFSGFTNLTNGAFLAGWPDLFSWLTHDNAVDLGWNDMTNAGRAASAVNTRGVVWKGLNAAVGMPEELHRGNVMELEVNAPPPIAGIYPAQGASFGGVPPMEMPGDVELVDDGTALPTEGCNPLVNFIQGRIAMVDRGSCEFGVKAVNAENAGAVAVIVANFDPSQTGGGDDLIVMAGGDQGAQVTIPAEFIGYTDGQTIQANLPGVNATNRVIDRWGTDADGDPLLYTPSPLQLGSSVFHWEITPFEGELPDLLMEPSISLSLFRDLDITPGQLEDVGWGLIFLFEDGFESGDWSVWSGSYP